MGDSKIDKPAEAIGSSDEPLGAAWRSSMPSKTAAMLATLAATPEHALEVFRERHLPDSGVTVAMVAHARGLLAALGGALTSGDGSGPAVVESLWERLQEVERRNEAPKEGTVALSDADAGSPGAREPAAPRRVAPPAPPPASLSAELAEPSSPWAAPAHPPPSPHVAAAPPAPKPSAPEPVSPEPPPSAPTGGASPGEVDATSFVVLPTIADEAATLPFAGAGDAPPSALPVDPHPDTGATAFVSVLDPSSPTTPFSPEHGLPIALETYAAILVELERSETSGRPAVLARHGIDGDEAWQRIVRAMGQHLRHHPDELARLRELCERGAGA